MGFKIANNRHKSILQRNAMAKRNLKGNAFEEWYGDDCKDRQCEYCLIKESEIRTLINSGKIRTKRLTTRGRTMEVDRRDPRGHYEVSNLVMSCYWCNNAKTDEFTYEEFRAMSCNTPNIWKNRFTTQSNIAVLEAKDKLFCEWNQPRGIVIVLPYGLERITEEKKLFCDILKLICNVNKFEIKVVYKDTTTSTTVTKIRKAIDEIIEVNKDITFISISQLKSMWIKGSMPLAINKADKVLKAVYSPFYYNNPCLQGCNVNYRQYAYYEHVAALEITDALDLQTRYLSENGSGYWYENCEDNVSYDKDKTDIQNRPILLDMNDLVHNGNIGFISQRVLDENYCEDKDSLIDCLKQYTGLNCICIIDAPSVKTCKKDEKGKSLEYGFLSDKIRFLNVNTLLVSEKYKLTSKDNQIKLELSDKSEEKPTICDGIEIIYVDFDLTYLRLGKNIYCNNATENMNNIFSESKYTIISLNDIANESVNCPENIQSSVSVELSQITWVY